MKKAAFRQSCNGRMRNKRNLKRMAAAFVPDVKRPEIAENEKYTKREERGEGVG